MCCYLFMSMNKYFFVLNCHRFGGWLWSTRRSDGAVFEHGPRGIRPAGAVGRNTLNMVEDVGLEKEILPVTYSHVASKNRYLYVGGKLHKMPSGISGLLQKVQPFSRPLMFSLVKEIMVKKSQEEDESVYSFVSRRLGKELAEIAVDSLCRGVFAGDCRKLSVRSCFPVLYNAEQRRGSLILGMLLGPGPVILPGCLAQRSVKESWAQWSLKRGIESFPEAIIENLQQSQKAELHPNAAVKKIDPSTPGWKVHLEDGVISADYIISALPAKALSTVLPPSCPQLIQQLQDIAMATVAVVNLEYDGSILPVMGFGHLVPSSEDRALLGVVYDSVPYPQHNRPGALTTRLTVMMGGAWFQEAFGDPEAVNEEALLTCALNAVRCHLGVMAPPSWSRVAVHKDCLPQYYLGHFRKVELMRDLIRQSNMQLSLTGSSYDGAAVNDVIFSARTAAANLLGTGI
uniref:Protoporphyrinogen oxidase n=1 Tax=Gouania willdenowi TaxID=441366 RepID=A0A8C5DA73_GOUWI